jgi:eukaryotic-like serine/threonine-protein kinase
MMTINAGTSLGPYEVLREIGRGGMGIVYLANDTRLDRQVAIKALPEHLANDPDRLGRFEREAKTLASLNHPNIAAIYGFESFPRAADFSPRDDAPRAADLSLREAPGVEGATPSDRPRRLIPAAQDETFYLILEYVEGETLAERLDRGALPIDEALEVCTQIAAGVEAAHEAGVIHRDLKPGNIIITPEGKVKVLDFGLAKVAEGSSSGSHQSETVTSPVYRQHSPTMPGVILGTAAYMSPEQARGRSIDKRTDIWSFGVVLYECLTGLNPFVGETVTDSIGAILHKDVDLNRLPPTTPSIVRHVLRRCLQRDKLRRLQAIGDARIELDATETHEALVPASNRLGVSTALMACVLTAAVVGIGVWFLKPSTTSSNTSVAPPPVFDAHIILPAGQRLGHGMYPGLAISRNGRKVAFPVMNEPPVEDAARPSMWVARTGIVVRQLDRPGLIQVPGTDDRSFQPVFSPDGEWIAFVSGRGDIYKTPVAGGQPIRLASTDSTVSGLAWTDDNTIIIGHRFESGLMQVPAAGGSLTPLTQPEGGPDDRSHGLPHALPGSAVLYTAYSEGNSHTTSIWALDRATGERTRLIEDAAHGQYAGGHIVFIREGNLMAVPFDPVAHHITSDARQLGESTVQSKYFGNQGLMTAAGQFALSPSGALVIGEGTVPAEALHTPVWLDRDGTETPIDVPARQYIQSFVSRDGARTLLSTHYGPSITIWLHDNERRTTRRVINPSIHWTAFGPGPDEVTCYRLTDDGRMQLGILPIDGTHAEFSPIDTPDATDITIAEWSRDGTRLLAVGRSSGGALSPSPRSRNRIWIYDREDGWSMLSRESEYMEGWPTFSPDGRWLAYASNETGEWEVYVRPILESGGAGPPQQVSIGGDGGWPRWSHDGQAIYYRTGRSRANATQVNQRIFSVGVVPEAERGDRLLLGRPELVIETSGRYVRLTPVSSWSIAPDGRFLLIKAPSGETTYEYMQAMFPDRIRVIQNWASTLEERAP